MASSQHSLLLSAEQLRKLGLTQQPFDHSSQHFSFFLSDSLTMLLNVVKHNLFESNDLQIIKGEKGTGKSCFSLLLQQAIQNDAISIIIQGRHNLHASDIFQQMLSLFQSEPGHSLKECLISLAHHLKESIKKHRMVVIIIDDSDKIPAKNLEYILQSLEALNEVLHHKLNIVLLGENKLESMLNHFALKAVQQGKVQSLLLRPLNPQQYQAYLQHLLKTADSVEPLALTDEQINQLQQQSHGIPGLLNQAWLDIHFQPEKNSTYAWKKIFQTLRLKPQYSLILATGLLLSAIIPGFISNKPSQKPIEKHLPIKPVQTEPETTQNTIPLAEKQPDQKKPSPVASIHPATPINIATKKERTIATETSTNKKQAENKAVEITISELTKKTIPSSSNYTIQLLASSQKKLMEQYIYQYFQTGEFFYYPKKLNKKVTLYILLHGNYKSLEQARQVAENYPEDIKKNKPWIRRFKSIQKSMME